MPALEKSDGLRSGLTEAFAGKAPGRLFFIIQSVKVLLNEIDNLLKLSDIFLIDIHQRLMSLQHGLGAGNPVRGPFRRSGLRLKTDFPFGKIEQLFQSESEQQRLVQITGIEKEEK